VARTVRNPWGNVKRSSPDELNPTVYEEMLQLSTICRQALRFTKNSIISLIDDYQNDDEVIQAGVRWSLNEMQGTWRNVLSNALDAIWFGFNVQELVWEALATPREGVSWTFSKVKSTPPPSWYPGGLVTDDYGNLKKLLQWKKTESEVELPLNKSVHWAFEGRGNVWGNPCARTAHFWYSTRRDTVEMWLIAMERLAAPIVVDLEMQGDVKGPDGLEVSNVEFSGQQWEKLSSGGVMVRQAAYDRDLDHVFPDIKMLGSGGWEEQFKAYADYAGREMFMAVGVPPLLQMEPQHASRAQSESIASLTQLMLLPTAEMFVEDVLVDQIVRPLVDYNWGPQDNYGKFPIELPVDEEQVASIVREMSQAGFLMPMNEAHYTTIEERLPGVLPAWEDHIKGGGFSGQQQALPGSSEPPEATPPTEPETQPDVAEEE